jgi:DNA repair protein RecO (recombination protein O)
MEWRDEGVILGARRHGESSLIVEAMTRDHGRHVGLVRAGRSGRQAALLQAGNRADIVWRARLEEHLGAFAIEPLELAAARLIGDAGALYGLATLAALLRLLPERDPHQGLYEGLVQLVGVLDDPLLAGPLLVRFELALLAELGFGLDLAVCAATGTTTDLAFVSPKTGRAVSREAGAPWRERLLALPDFLQGRFDREPDADDLAAAFRLTGHFLERDLFGPRGIAMPEARDRFVATIVSSARRSPSA